MKSSVICYAVLSPVRKAGFLKAGKQIVERDNSYVIIIIITTTIS